MLVSRSGRRRNGESAGVAEYRLDVAAAIVALRADTGAPGVQDVLRALERDGEG